MFYSFARIVVKLFYKIFFRVRTEGVERIPAEGPVVLCANHISGFDPPIVGIDVKRRVHYMAKEELFKVPFLSFLIRQLGAFPVKRGGVSKESIRHTISLLRDGNILGIFPEGTTRGTGGIGKKGAASFALKSGAVVIPVAIIGNYKLFRPMLVRYGEPVDLSEYNGGSAEDLEKATEKIMSAIREMLSE